MGEVITMLSKSIGSNVKQFRIEKGLSQEELAEKLFVTRQTVSNYEIGKSNPDIDMLQKIATALEVELTWLLYGKPFQQERKADNRTALIMTAVFFSVSILALVLTIHTNALKSIGIAMPNVIVRLFLLPIFFLLFGMWIINMIDYFIGICRPKQKIKKLGNILTLSFLGINLCFIFPDMVYCFIYLFDKVTMFDGIYLFIKDIPVINYISFLFLNLMYIYPYTYIILGVSLFLFCLSKK